MSEESPMVMDIRPILESGREPFSEIMRAASMLGAGEEMVLLAPFEPLPLIGVLSRQGFECENRASGPPDGWSIRIRRSSVLSGNLELDLRPLPPAATGERALAQCSLLGRGETLSILTTHYPSELLPILPDHGFEGDSEPAASGHWVTRIWRITRG